MQLCYKPIYSAGEIKIIQRRTLCGTTARDRRFDRRVFSYCSTCSITAGGGR
jgi:hypothetical protein